MLDDQTLTDIFFELLALYQLFGADDDGEESREEICGDDTYEPLRTLIQKELTETLFSAYNALSYKEQEVIRIRTGVCPDCHRVQNRKYKSPTFYETAISL